MDAPTEKTVQYLPSDQVRDTLGSRMAWVNGTGGILIITASGAPDGALVPPGLLAGAGLAPVGEQGVRQARAHWGAARARAAAEGPQGLTRHKNLLAVLVDQTTAAALTRRMPVLAFDELELTGFALANGELIAPGEYAAHNGTTLRIHAPREEETQVDTTDLRDPKTPVDVVFEVLQNTAARTAAAYMRAAEAATTPEEEKDAEEKMTRAWQIKRRRHLTRDEMIALIEQLQEEIDLLRRA